MANDKMQTRLCERIAELEKENAELLESCKDKDRQLNKWFLSYNDVMQENEELKAQVEQLSYDNHVLKTSFITQQEQIKKMKPYCKKLCKNYIKTGFMGNDCYNGVCRNCDKWEFAE